jgi:hypothetical protein
MTYPSNTILLSLCCLALLLPACKDSQGGDPNARFELLSPDKSGIRFLNKVENTEDFNIFSYRNFYNGGGVAIGDLNNDGLSDVYLTSNMGDNQLYLNKGNMRFENVTEKAGVAGRRFWSTGVVLVDINADGLLDIYVCNAGYKADEKPENELFINQGVQNGVPVFVEKAAEYGLNEDGYTTHAAFFDYDLDGDLDCYILNNSFMPVNTLNYSNNREMYAEEWPVRDFLKGGGDKLLRNDGGKFTNVTRQAGIFGSLIGFGLGITVGDVNGDHLPDLYVSNDFYERDYLYINQGNGTFKEEIEQWMEHLSLASMGTDMADVNNDGFPEIFTTEMLPGDETRLKTNTLFENFNIHQLKLDRGFYYQFMQNSLQLNNKDRSFSEIAYYSGVAASDWSWGALLFDMDNDGWRDIYVCNGIYKDVTDQDFMDFFADEVVQKMALTGKKEQINEILNRMPSYPIPNKAFRNTGPSLKFEDAGKNWGFSTPSCSNGAAYGDLDNDGDLDLVINNVNQEAMLYRNRTREMEPQKHYLKLALVGKGQNARAIGATATLHQKGQQHSCQLVPSRGFQSSVDYTMVFGLGENAAPDSLVVVWPDRSTTLLPRPPVDTLLQLHWAAASPQKAGDLYAHKAQNPVAQAVANTFGAHREDNYVDFYQENLVYRMVSREGPKADVADVNGDGRDDLYIGGGTRQPGRLYLQAANGSFAPGDRATFDRDSLYEDTEVLFFDADGDRDADLFVGSGGNALPPNSRFMQNRIYFNNGKGDFTLNERALPLNGYNTAVAVPLDFDGDGDLDLFVGSRSIPGQYGLPPRHFLYENNGTGEFRDVTRNAAPELQRMGMVTDAQLVNLVGDASPELVVVGEWRSPKVLEIKDKQLVPLATNLDQYPGWWYAIAHDDVDGDGDQDLILGNRGENFYFQGSPEAPAKLWLNDFDQNGTVEKISTRSIGGKDLPLPMKKELTAQVPSLKKQNLKHTDYAQKSIQELFPAAAIKSALVLEGKYFQSAVALNQGNGQFELLPLPQEVQYSCVCAIWCGDLNGDGRKDLVLGGNDTGFMPQFSRLDASFGHVLLNAGKGQYTRMENRDSGLSARGDLKAIVPLRIRGKNHLLLTLNDRAPKLFELK